MAIIKKSLKHGVTAVRVHESGDFYSQEYANKWETIAKSFPNLRFFAYTKSDFRPCADNFNIVESVLPDGSINFGDDNFITEKKEKYGYPVCPVTLGEGVKCGSDCKLCQDVSHVLFKKH